MTNRKKILAQVFLFTVVSSSIAYGVNALISSYHSRAPKPREVYDSKLAESECSNSTTKDSSSRLSRGTVPPFKRYLDETKGVPMQDLVDDLMTINTPKSENLGYPTQKPVALLERIIQASSNEGDVVLDFFCGWGTTIAAAQKLNREWIGIDVTHLSVGLMKLRLKDSFGMLPAGTNCHHAGNAGALACERPSGR